MSIARKSAVDAISQVGVVAVSMASGIFVSRWLGAEGRGAYRLASGLATQILINLGNLGLNLACQVYVAKDRKLLAPLHTLSAMVYLAVSVLFGLVVLLFAPFLQEVVLKGIPIEYLWLVTASLPFILYQITWRGLMIGLGEIKKKALVEFLFAAGQSASIIAIVLTVANEPVRPLVYAFYAVTVITSLVMLAMLRKHGRMWECPAWSLCRDVFHYAKWVYAGNMAATFRTQIDQMMVNYSGGEAALGIYDQAASLSTRGWMVSRSLDAAAYEPITSGTPREAGRLVAAGVRQMLILGGAITLAGWIAAPLIPLIYGAEFEASVWPFRVLLAAISFGGCARILAIYFSGHLAKPAIPMMINWLTIGFQVGLCLLLARGFGALAGITYGTAATYVLTTLLFAGFFLARPETPPVGELVRLRAEDFRKWLALVPMRFRKGR